MDWMVPYKFIIEIMHYIKYRLNPHAAYVYIVKYELK